MTRHEERNDDSPRNGLECHHVRRRKEWQKNTDQERISRHCYGTSLPLLLDEPSGEGQLRLEAEKGEQVAINRSIILAKYKKA